MATPLIDQREYERLVRFIEDYQLARHKPQLAALAKSINVTNPTSIDVHLFASLRAGIAPFELFHREHPFVIAPPGILDQGDLVAGYQVPDGLPFRLRSDRVEHVLVVAPTGAGKSHFLSHLIAAVLELP